MSAHTSAGKTVVAEYATALGFKQGQRVVYTSPLKVGLRQRHVGRAWGCAHPLSVRAALALARGRARLQVPCHACRVLPAHVPVTGQLH